MTDGPVSETALPEPVPSEPALSETALSPGWHSLHLFLHTSTEDTDAFLTEDLAPLLDRLVAEQEAAGWFFIRYGEGGPHLRIRVRAPAAAAVAELPGALARLAKARPAVDGPWPSHHGEVRAVPYTPETGRYGGPLALPVAEDIFTVSSRVAVEALRRTPHGAERLILAADLAHTTASALGMDRLTAARWLRRHAAGWRWITEVALLPSAVVHTRVNSVYALQREALTRRAEALRESLERDTAAPWLTEWAQRVRSADQWLRACYGEADADADADADATEAGRRPAWVWASQLHMLFNRLGVTPDEERAVCRLAARTLLDPGEPPAFFAAGHRAPDHQYLEQSKFQIGRNADSAVRPLTPMTASGATAVAVALPEISLPADPLPDISLRTAMTSRTSVRGALRAPLTSAGLGTLLWNAHADSHHSTQRLADGTVRHLTHRPYPSAGALYTTGLRVFVLGVDGVPPGTYQCVPQRRALRRIGPVPPVEEIKALSTYLSRSPDDPDWIGIDDAPAVLGLYVDLGLLRQRYGLRALRLGLLEAGHLAQTLVLTAAALGLATSTLAGIHDDVAHELFGLDDLDQPLQYLMPLGRAAG
ncbi:thiopeptide-type bacteriocin biosynthesis protein [Streptomyces sp. NPDC059477]|uniref:thiopeptide-type bacteriocin biosynthesis protein n=1 Tax=Streptomyces sp. NPDC059477 TaxID=3346847 RepID=UPI0036A30825